MNTPLTNQILQKIKQYSRIILSRHIRPDGDALGSTLGLAALLRNSYPDKEIYVIGDDHSQGLSFLGPEDEQLPEESYRDALLIVLDTASFDRVSNHLAGAAREIVKIDHHIDISPFGDLSWVEDYRSSTCEMIVALWQAHRDELNMNLTAATYLYTGMVTDSGRFRIRDTSGETMRLAGALLDLGIDTETLYARLYLETMEEIKFRSALTGKIKMTPGGVAYLYISQATQKKYGMTSEQASNCVSLLSAIRDSIIWMALIENADGTVRVRLRSRFVPINTLAECYHGGGHAFASGATVYSLKERNALLRDADELIRTYKSTNEGWL